MKIAIDGMAWLCLADMETGQAEWLRRQLTLVDLVTRGRRIIVSSCAYVEKDGFIGIPRGFFRESLMQKHDVTVKASTGRAWPAPSESDVESPGISCDGIQHILDSFRGELPADGIIATGDNGDAVGLCLAVADRLKVPTLVICQDVAGVSKWMPMVNSMFPLAVLGVINSDGEFPCDCHIVVSTLENVCRSIHSNMNGDEFGFVISERLDKMNPDVWSLAMRHMSAFYRLGIAPKNMQFEGISRLFSYHLGNWIFAPSGNWLTPKIRRVMSGWKPAAGSMANLQFMSRASLLDLMCVSPVYNDHVVEQIVLALDAGRKSIVFSERYTHLTLLRDQIETRYRKRIIRTDSLIPGMSDDDLKSIITRDVVFARYGDDIPETVAMDTVVLATTIRYPEQAISSILSRFDGKKDPIVVDMRCDVPLANKDASYRDDIYIKVYETND